MYVAGSLMGGAAPANQRWARAFNEIFAPTQNDSRTIAKHLNGESIYFMVNILVRSSSNKLPRTGHTNNTSNRRN